MDQQVNRQVLRTWVLLIMVMTVLPPGGTARTPPPQSPAGVMKAAQSAK
jgi:hypothetical protein